MYSYKLKKSGLRTQVAMDCNGMALFVSKSSPCKDFADGTMLLAMKIDKKIHELDCIALDGGYPQFLRRLVDESDSLTLQNFAHPYRKKKNQDLTEEESQYNSTFGSFRSQIESLFGDLGSIFEKHNNRAPVLVEKKQTYNLQLKLSLLLLNMKKMVIMLKIPEEPIHTAWCRDGFEYPALDGDVEQPIEYVDIGALVEDGNTMAKLQEEFLGLELHDEDMTMEAPERKKASIVIEIPVRKKKEHMDNKMYVQLTIGLITKAIEHFCTKKGMEMNARDAKKIVKMLSKDDEVDKHFFCEATCVKSKHICMKKVDDEDALCYVHDPNRKCQGKTKKGDRCGSVAKVGEKYCGRHRHAKEENSQKTPIKNTKTFAKKKTKKNMKNQDEDESSEDELVSHKKSHKPHSPEDVVDSEEESEEEVPPKKKKSKKSKPAVSSEDEENVSEEEEIPKKRGKKAKCKEPSHDESVSDKESSSDEETPKEKQSKKHDRKKQAKQNKHVPSDDEQSGEDEPVSKKKSKNAKTDESEANILWESFPPVYDNSENSVVLSEKQLPTKIDLIWKICLFDKSHGYSTNFVLDGCHLLKKWQTDEIVAQLWKMPAKDDFAYCRGKPFAENSKKALVDMGFTVNELPKDYKPPAIFSLTK
ncbi:hypothetical protein EDD11_010048 [Mortierella claussenii]|nr:hypothetical protein EDD11_010048 [Mortierella claussenii]